MPEHSEIAASVTHLNRSFDGTHAVISDLSLSLRDGDFTVLLGPSGCGKSTLLRILAGLDREFTGDVLIPAERAVAFQQPRLFPWKRIWKNVVAGLRTKQPRDVALRALAEVGLTQHIDAWPKALSGGEAQRVSLARALVREPRLLLLDEPFSALDALTRITARRLVLDLWKRHGPAVLLVTHDVEEAILLADRVLVMRNGTIEHDITLRQERPRTIDDPDLVVVRRRLLGWLGVDADAAAKVGDTVEERPVTVAPDGGAPRPRNPATAEATS